MEKEVGAIRIIIYTDSKLVEGQVTGEYEAKEDRMKKYMAKVRSSCLILTLSRSNISREVKTSMQTDWHD